MTVVPPDRALSRVAAFVGVADTDYASDYAAVRAKTPGYVGNSPEAFGASAFERALADAGLTAGDIDGLITAVDYGRVEPEMMAEQLGITPRYTGRGQVMMTEVVPMAVAALARGECDTVALVYGTSSRSAGRQFGGDASAGGGRHSYYYYHPWGWSSQAAHWALMFSRYQAEFGATEADLGSVAVTLRDAAATNENAIMRTPITVDDYLSSRYIVRPLHLLDICLVNDGGVCLILQRADRAADRPHTPVLVSGWTDLEVQTAKMKAMVKDRLQPLFKQASTEVLDMARRSLADVDHFQGYDAASIHLINQLEGYGFAPPGEGLERCKAGEYSLTGALPMNTSGGMLSEAYMHGWNQVVEAIRQLRHEAGARQVPGVQMSLFSMATTESAHPLLMERGA